MPHALAKQFSGVCYCVRLFQHSPRSSSSQSPLSPHQSTNQEEAGQAQRAGHKKPSSDLICSSNLRRASSLKDLISKFSGPCPVSPVGLRVGPALKSASAEPPKSTAEDSPLPSITVTAPLRQTGHREVGSPQRETLTSQTDCPVGGKTQVTDSSPDSVTDSGLGSVRTSQPAVRTSLHEMQIWHFHVVKTACSTAVWAFQCYSSPSSNLHDDLTLKSTGTLLLLLLIKTVSQI